jgi:predicted nucleic acid-binding protein
VTTVFADTYYYLALLNADDDDHARVAEWTARFAGRIVTTDWVLTELADGLSRGAGRAIVGAFVRDLLGDEAVTVVPAERTLFDRGLDLYEKRPDKSWSLTDCTSFVVMEREKISQALTADHHFEQAGFVVLLKPDQ